MELPQENLFSGFFDEWENLVFILSPEGKILYTNPSVRAELGFGKQELSTMDFQELQPPGQKEESREAFRTILSGKNRRATLPLRSKKGATPTFSVQSWSATSGEHAFRFVSCSTLSAAQQSGPKSDQLPDETFALKEALELELQMQDLVMGISELYLNLPLHQFEKAIDQFLGDLASFVGADRAYIFRYDFDKQTTSNTFEWCSKGIEPQIDALQHVPLAMIPDWVETHRKGQVMDIPDVFRLSPDDGVRQILEPQEVKSLLTYPLRVSNELFGFVGFDWVRQPHTCTRRERRLLSLFSQLLVNVHMRQRLETALERAHQSLQARSDFMANISHELRTPLNAIVGFSHIALESGVSPQLRKYLELIEQSGNALMEVVNSILDFSQVEAGKLQLSLVPFNLNELLQGLSQVFRVTASQKGLSFSTSFSPTLPQWIVGDEFRLRQALFQLLSNALKFTPAGSVHFSTSFCPVGEGEPENSLICFSIQDTGIGIPASQLRSIFEAFHQQEFSSTRSFGGAGVGLTLANRLVEMMGGSLSVESTPGKGSTFLVQLPIPKSK